MTNFIPNYTPEILEMHKKLEESCARVVKEHQIAIEHLTEKQIAEAFKQAVLSGDFQVHIVHHAPVEIPVWNGTLDIPSPKKSFEICHAQSVTYLPYREVETLRSEVERLKALLEKNGIEYRVTEEFQ